MSDFDFPSHHEDQDPHHDTTVAPFSDENTLSHHNDGINEDLHHAGTEYMPAGHGTETQGHHTDAAHGVGWADILHPLGDLIGHPVEQLIGYTRFEPTVYPFEGFGHPTEDMNVWHMQTHPDTCAVVSQEFVIDSLLDHPVPEDQLRQEAIDHGWYTPGGGTPLDSMGNLLELHGIDVEQHYGSSLHELEQQLDEGHKVIVAVDAHEIWHDLDASAHVPLSDFGAIPGMTANHAVEVIGVDTSDPQHPMVILNDPGTPDGMGLMVPATEFETAWSASDNFLVHTSDDHQAHSELADTMDGANGPSIGDWVWYDGHWISV
jgi:hypothetical protein